MFRAVIPSLAEDDDARTISAVRNCRLTGCDLLGTFQNQQPTQKSVSRSTQSVRRSELDNARKSR